MTVSKINFWRPFAYPEETLWDRNLPLYLKWHWYSEKMTSIRDMIQYFWEWTTLYATPKWQPESVHMHNFQLPYYRCRDASLINQVVIGSQAYDDGCSCSINLDADSWNNTFTFPLVAAIDNKIDQNQMGTLSVKLRVRGSVVPSQTKTYDVSRGK